MPDRCDAETDQIIGHQLRQHSGVDVVGGEGRRILLEPEPAQPFGYIHCSCPEGDAADTHYNPGAVSCADRLGLRTSRASFRACGVAVYLYVYPYNGTHIEGKHEDD